ncbi:MAG: hypothetical protein PWR07_1767 [Bacillota bacterium]|nr:hypothetical protein [Bacillota bacterium]
MAKLMPFRAVYYDPGKVGADLGDVIAPPYDVVDAEKGRRLADQHPWNVVRLELTIPPPGGQDPALYANAARLWRTWRREGVLVADSEPSLYLCEHEFEWQGIRYTRTAVMGLLDLSEGVLPHEETMARAKEDRMNLVRASHALPSPMLGLYEDPSGKVASMLARVRAASGPDLTATLPAETLRVWRIPDEASSAAIVQAVGSGPVVIADGHHRCESMKRLARETGDPRHMRILAALVSTSDPGVVVLPTHRVIAGWPEGSDADLVERVLSAFDVIDTRPLPPGPGEDAPRRLWTWLRSRISCSGGKTSFVVVTRASLWILAYDGDTPEMLRRLDLEIAEEAVSRRKAVPDAACEVAYIHNGPAGLAAIASGRTQVAVFPPAIPASEILKKAREGYLFPRKTTYFLPKAPAGLLMWDLDD